MKSGNVKTLAMAEYHRHSKQDILAFFALVESRFALSDPRSSVTLLSMLLEGVSDNVSVRLGETVRFRDDWGSSSGRSKTCKIQWGIQKQCIGLDQTSLYFNIVLYSSIHKGFG